MDVKQRAREIIRAVLAAPHYDLVAESVCRLFGAGLLVTDLHERALEACRDFRADGHLGSVRRQWLLDCISAIGREALARENPKETRCDCGEFAVVGTYIVGGAKHNPHKCTEERAMPIHTGSRLPAKSEGPWEARETGSVTKEWGIYRNTTPHPPILETRSLALYPFSEPQARAVAAALNEVWRKENR